MLRRNGEQPRVHQVSPGEKEWVWLEESVKEISLGFEKGTPEHARNMHVYMCFCVFNMFTKLLNDSVNIIDGAAPMMKAGAKKFRSN